MGLLGLRSLQLHWGRANGGCPSADLPGYRAAWAGGPYSISVVTVNDDYLQMIRKFGFEQATGNRYCGSQVVQLLLRSSRSVALNKEETSRFLESIFKGHILGAHSQKF